MMDETSSSEWQTSTCRIPEVTIFPLYLIGTESGPVLNIHVVSHRMFENNLISLFQFILSECRQL
jgi:hypothetical protein